MSVRSVGGMRWWLRDHPDVADALCAGAMLVVALVGYQEMSEPAPQGGRAVVGALLLVALFLPLARRRHEPRIVLWAVTAAASALWIGDFVDGSAFAGAVAFYSVGRYVDRPASVRAFVATTTVLVAVSGVLAASGSEQNPWFALVGRVGLVVGSFWFGDSQRSRIALVASLHAQALQVEADRILEARQAVLDERSRIARELHDVVAHSVSVMVIQAAAAQRLAAKDPEGAVASIGSVAEVGRAALGEMRRVLGILDGGASPADFAPQPTLSDLDAIVERCRAAGLTVEFARSGVQPVLSAGMELSIVRIVQESLTNVIKHAGRAEARVGLDFGDVVTIEVSDNGMGTVAAGDGRGRGVLGMRERVDAHGGTFSAGPRPGGGFVVRAVLPLDASPSAIVDQIVRAGA
jgi:signal transduction histidine kinase